MSPERKPKPKPKPKPKIKRSVITEKDYLYVVWNYFQFHADQRLRTFHFYIIFATLLFTGYIAVLETLKIPEFGVVIGILIIIFSIIFWKIDKRNRVLIRNALSALQEYESSFLPVIGKPKNLFKIITNDYQYKEDLCKNEPLQYALGLYRYSHCFNLIFFILGFVGFLAFLYSLVQTYLN